MPPFTQILRWIDILIDILLTFWSFISQMLSDSYLIFHLEHSKLDGRNMFSESVFQGLSACIKMLALCLYFNGNILKLMNTIHSYLCIWCRNFSIFHLSAFLSIEEINSGSFMTDPRLSTMLYKNIVLKFNLEEVDVNVPYIRWNYPSVKRSINKKIELKTMFVLILRTKTNKISIIFITIVLLN